MNKEEWIGKKLTNGEGGPEIGHILDVDDKGQLVVTIYGQPGTYLFNIKDKEMKCEPGS